MPSAYYGQSGNVVYPGSVNISSSTNASPIVVTTASPHGLQTGDLADIRGHQVNTAANGVRTVTRTGANTFSINGSTGNGVGAGTGTVQPINYGSGYNIPSDGDARNAASANVAFQTLGDRSAADLISLPVYKLALEYAAAVSGNAHGTICMQGTGPANGFIPMTGMNGALTSYPFAGFMSNDIAEVTLETTASVSTTSAVATIATRVTLALGWQAYGAGAPLVFTRPAKAITGVGSSATNFIPLTLRTWEVAPNPLPADGSIGFGLYVAFYFDTFNASANLNFVDDFLLTVKGWRPTGVPQ